MAVQTVRRLPGFRFEVQSPPLEEALPRMDVAVFVGFAASGPLHTPVAVEDVAEFNAVFGSDAALAWDKEAGGTRLANLASSVRAFFRNGGRRCWIVRVAGDTARSNCFPVPNLAVARFDSSGKVVLAPACATARSEGSWSDALRLSTALWASPVAVTVLRNSATGGVEADLLLNSEADVVPGTLLRLSCRSENYVGVFAVEAVAYAEESTAGIPATVASSRIIWLRTAAGTLADSLGTGSARIFTTVPADESCGLTSLEASIGDALEIVAEPQWSSWSADQQVKFEIRMPLADVPDTGSLIRFDYGAEQFWLAVYDYGVKTADDTTDEIIEIIGQGFWLLKDVPDPASVLFSAEILSFDLETGDGETQSFQLSQVGFHRGHPKYWANLPADIDLYQSAETPFRKGQAELSFERTPLELWPVSSGLRFPLAAAAPEDVFFLPVAMPSTADQQLGRLTAAATALERDGLSNFSAALFVDAEMIDAGLGDLMNRADFLRYLSPNARRLHGIHAALSIEEATIIAVPDASHGGWIPRAEATPLAGQIADPLPQPDPSRFHECGIRTLATPTLSLQSEPDTAGTFALAWTSPEAAARYVLQEALEADFSDAAEAYSGTDSTIAIYGRSPGEYFYRVHSVIGKNRSDWSTPLTVSVLTGSDWESLSTDEFSSNDLLGLHRSLIRMCAARGDLLAVLSLPPHFREDDAISYVNTLKSPRAAAVDIGEAFVSPLGSGEAAAFSYAALYHPWLTGREFDDDDEVRSAPPDGAACGVIAARAISRGAWVAPANERLSAVVTLTPLLSRSRYLDLQEVQINVVRQEPRGFMWLSADTLSDDPDLRPINVRRLLILLRRLALKVGARYVFEPNSDAFRRSVQRGFEAVLDRMFVRGAFAGTTPETSYQVVTAASLNTPQSVDMGRFIVELKVAPSLPLTFLTIRLVQTGDRATVVEVQ